MSQFPAIPMNVGTTANSPAFAKQAPGTRALTGVSDEVIYSGANSLRSALFVGDSITDFANSSVVATSVTDLGNNTGRIVRNGHLLGVGDPFRLTAGPALNTLSAVVTSVIDANTFDFVASAPISTVIGNNASILFGYRTSGTGWPTWLDSNSGVPLNRTWCAAGGATISQISYLLDRIAPGTEDMAFVMAGMNDIYAAGSSLAQMQTDFTYLMSGVRKRSSRIAVFSVSCRNSADSVWSAAKQTVHTAFNKWLYNQCALNGWIFIDTWASSQNGVTYVNSSATNPDPSTNFLKDNTHPSMRGAKALADALWAKIQGWYGVTNWKAPHPAAIGTDSGNLLTGSTFATDTTTAGVADGWLRDSVTANMSAVYTLANRTVATDGDACGRKQVITTNYGTATGTASFRFRKNGIQALLTPGNKYVLSVPFKVTNALGLVGLEIAMIGNRADGNWFWVVGNGQDSNTAPLLGTYSGVLMTPIATAPNNLTNLDIWVRSYITSAQNTDMVLELWQPELRQVG